MINHPKGSDAWFETADDKVIADMEIHGSVNNIAKAKQEIEKRHRIKTLNVARESNRIAAKPDWWARGFAGIAIALSIVSLCVSIWGK